jgi:hypothetical protein
MRGKQTGKWIVVVGAGWLACVGLARAQSGTAPTISPAGPVYVTVDANAKQTFTASGGEALEPQTSPPCPPWVKKGTPHYYWRYDTLQGTPASQSEGGTLQMNRDQTGSTTIKVEMTQDWEDSGTPPQASETTESPDSTGVLYTVAPCPDSVTIAVLSPSDLNVNSVAPFTLVDMAALILPVQSRDITQQYTWANSTPYGTPPDHSYWRAPFTHLCVYAITVSATAGNCPPVDASLSFQTYSTDLKAIYDAYCADLAHQQDILDQAVADLADRELALQDSQAKRAKDAAEKDGLKAILDNYDQAKNVLEGAESVAAIPALVRALLAGTVWGALVALEAEMLLERILTDIAENAGGITALRDQYNLFDQQVFQEDAQIAAFTSQISNLEAVRDLAERTILADKNAMIGQGICFNE